jgi:hypothetical protein
MKRYNFVCNMQKFGHKEEIIGDFDTFKQARAHITEALEYDHLREDHPALKAPVGIDKIVTDGDYTYWIEKLSYKL